MRRNGGRPAFLIACALVLLGTAPAAAQTYPSKPIRIVVPFVAGGAVDLLARIMGQKLTEVARPARHHREPPRRRRQRRVGPGREVAARRLHHPAEHQRPRDQPGALQEAAVRSGEGSRAGDAAGRVAAAAGRDAVAAGEDHARADRAREGEARHAQLRHDRRRQSAAPDHGNADARGRREIPADPLSRRRAAQHRADRGRGRISRSCRSRPPGRTSRPASCARSAIAGAKRSPSLPDVPTIAESGVPASNRGAGRAGSCRPERRPR